MSGDLDLLIFCPLPPVRSGIADYIYDQLAHFPSGWQIGIVVEQDESCDLSHLPNIRVIPIKHYHATAPHAPHRLYHLGNNSHHIFVFEELLRSPGTVVLHDVCQHHLITEYTLARGNRLAYRDYLYEELGEHGHYIADSRQSGVWSDLYNFLVPLNQPALNAATGVIVHSEWARVQVSGKVPDTPVCVIPHHHPDTIEPKPDDRRSARERLDISEDQLVYLSLGFVTPPKQVELTLKALGNIKEQLPDFGFYIVGEAHDKRKLGNEIKAAKLSDKTRLTGYVSLQEMEDYIKAADVIVNLRYPTAGESSGTLARAMGEGRCTVVFDYASFSDYPDGTLCKLPLETTHTDQLEAALLELALNTEKRHEIEENAREHIEIHHKIDDCVGHYVEFLSTEEIVNYG